MEGSGVDSQTNSFTESYPFRWEAIEISWMLTFFYKILACTNTLVCYLSWGATEVDDDLFSMMKKKKQYVLTHLKIFWHVQEEIGRRRNAKTNNMEPDGSGVRTRQWKMERYCCNVISGSRRPTRWEEWDKMKWKVRRYITIYRKNIYSRDDQG